MAATLTRADELAAAAAAENWAACQKAITDAFRALDPLTARRFGRRVPDAKREPDYTRGQNPRRNVQVRADQFDSATGEWEGVWEVDEDCFVHLRVERRPGGTWVPAAKPFAAQVAGRLQLHKSAGAALAASGG